MHGMKTVLIIMVLTLPFIAYAAQMEGNRDLFNALLFLALILGAATIFPKQAVSFGLALKDLLFPKR